ncbi:MULTISPECIES: protein kinase domain-containing protein [unclassified Streptomyces]|uniref:serine/threonine-protein kinase n=1 Tax=unclassified Streptomyces TaxID=2593676 RepID=UPI00093F2298|nr:serine/threonine-protein kinase [Streptomyces sp. TSRI0107]OKJ80400.1 serine/threonine protein kinase [Streptomyces sp. TSRI0107]
MPLSKDDPRSVGGYKLVDRLGAGGMGVVYRGRARSGREVAVKVVHAQYAQDPVFRARFRQEIEAVRKVSGAFTAPVVDADAEADRPWMATQYVPGRSLAERIRAQGPLRDAELRRLALGLVEALRDIHRAGVVHRDLKPANVLMAEDGPRVIDFGISRATENLTLTETGQMIGTPPFMSPEQFTDARSVGPASDVFSLGALLAYATTGRGPFDAESPYLTAYRVINDEPVLEGVPRQLRTLLERCLTKEREDRPGLDELAREFAAALPEPDPGDPATVTLRLDPSDLATTHPGTVADQRTTQSGRRPGRVRPLLAAAGTVGALALGLTAYLLGPGADGGAAPGPSAVPKVSAPSRWADLPKGWQPWQTTVFEKPARGAKPLGENGAMTGPECLLHESAVYCGGDAMLPVRVDALTGRTAWRADLLPDGVSGDRLSSAAVLGVADGVVVVRLVVSDEEWENDEVTLIGLDADDGGRLWTRPGNEQYADSSFADGLVVTPDAGGSALVARAARTGEERWRAKLPAGHYCTFLRMAPGLYTECSPETESENSVILELDAADGSVRQVKVPIESTLYGVVDGRLAFLQWAEDSGGLGTTDDAYEAILLVDPDTGDRKRVTLAEDFGGHPTLTDGRLLFTMSNGVVRAVSPTTGKELWETGTTLEQPGRAVLDQRGRTLFLASLSGRVAALDAREGTLLWETRPRSARVAANGWAQPEVVLHEGGLVVVTPDGTLFTVDPGHPDRKPAAG